MHEGLISRGQVQKTGKEDLIFHPCNLVFRHNDSLGCSHSGGIGGDKGFEISARYLIEHEGTHAVREWLVSMAREFPQVGPEALRRFDALELPKVPAKEEGWW
jgi:hypothetical protein